MDLVKEIGYYTPKMEGVGRPGEEQLVRRTGASEFITLRMRARNIQNLGVVDGHLNLILTTTPSCREV